MQRFLTASLLLCATTAFRASPAAPAPAPAGAPAPAKLEAIQLTFEIANYNYLDLDEPLKMEKASKTKTTLTKTTKVADETGIHVNTKGRRSNVQHTGARYTEAVADSVAATSHDVADASHKTTHYNTDEVSEGVKQASHTANHHANNANDGVHDAANKANDASHHHTKKGVDETHHNIKYTADKIKEKAHEAFLQTGIEPHVRDVLRDTVRDTVDEIIGEYYPKVSAKSPASAPSPATAATAFIAASPAAADSNPAPAPATPKRLIDVFVQFYPGKTRFLADSVQREDVGRAIIAEVTITGVPESGIDELPDVDTSLTKAKSTGDMNLWLSAAINDITDLIPNIQNINISKKNISQWLPEQCEIHMKDILQSFVMAYTRDRVPSAIYNECTNYAPRMSFSHDTISTVADKKKCREATAKFARRWNYGKDKDGNKKEANFAQLCLDICENKYGKDAPQCHVTKGDQKAIKAP